MKAFKTIILVHPNFTTKSYQQFIENKFIFHHPYCYNYKINKNIITASYTDPIYTAIILQKAKYYHCNISLLDDKQSRKLYTKKLSIKKKSVPPQVIKKFIKQGKLHIIYESKFKIIVKLPSFFKATQLLRSLKKNNVKLQKKNHSSHILN